MCAWTRDDGAKDPLLAVAGAIGVVKVINTRTQKVVATFVGHGDVRFRRQLDSINKADRKFTT